MAVEIKLKSGLGMKMTEFPPAVPHARITFKIEHRSGVFDPDRDHAYFWADDWQEGEQEADEDIRAGRVTSFDDPEEGIQYLRDLR